MRVIRVDRDRRAGKRARPVIPSLYACAEALPSKLLRIRLASLSRAALQLMSSKTSSLTNTQ